jgi:serine/threonine-protein kinase
MRLALGDAYDRLGRTEDARRVLAAARDERLAKDAADSISVLGARERWARFLVSTGDLDGASRELDLAVAALGKRTPAVAAALHDTRARVELARGNSAAALREANAALAAFDKVTGIYDVRLQPRLWRTLATALEASGNAAEARQWRAKALEASRQYDAPSSPTTRE